MRISRLAGGLAALAVLTLLLTAGPALAHGRLPSPNTYVVTVAQRCLGTPYVEGGHGPQGVDVPGFTKFVYGRAGKWLPQDVARQAKRGVAVKRAQLRRGDLVFDAALEHVGVYTGKAHVITMPGPGAVVVRQGIDDWGDGLMFRRLRSGTGSRVVAIAERYLGVPYVFGGASPSGFDASGLTMYCYAQAGIALDHGATDQQKACRPVSLGKLRPGDLVFFGNASYSHHVGIYVGGQTMIDAPHTGAVVQFDPIDSAWIGGRLLPPR
jgi:cell wall-associated NlpC family hydrolase